MLQIGLLPLQQRLHFKYRIGYAVKLYNEGKVPNLNINGLASECGFNNRNFFTTAFKELLGLTPSEYFKARK